MRNCKTVIIDRSGLAKIMLPLFMGVILAGVLLFSASNVRNNSTAYPTEDIYLRFMEDSLPLIYSMRSAERGIGRELKGLLDIGMDFLLNFDPDEPWTVFSCEIPVIKAVNSGYLMNKAKIVAQKEEKAEPKATPETKSNPGGEVYPIKEVDSGQGKNAGKIVIRNDTKYGVNIDEMLNSPLKFNMSGDGPKILIVHTHATESYSAEGADTYFSNQMDRNMDEEKNVIRVGKAMKKVFEEKGISVIHDTTLHDYPNFNGSYGNSVRTVEGYLKKYPGICIVLDVHRDAFVYEDGSKAKFVTTVNGTKAAQLMFVIGTDAGGLSHPNWRENMKLALKLQNHIGAKYPQLMRGVNLRTERFNGHTTYGSMIIEVGSSGNTMSEAVAGAELAAGEIAEFLNKEGKEK